MSVTGTLRIKQVFQLLIKGTPNTFKRKKVFFVIFFCDCLKRRNAEEIPRKANGNNKGAFNYPIKTNFYSGS